MISTQKQPERPATYAERQLVSTILKLGPGRTLPSERDLAPRLGVTRPTLREALQRLHRDGWIAIRQGKPTVIRDFWHEGGLNVLGAISRHARSLPSEFIPSLLDVRLALAPAYTRAAVERSPEKIADVLARAHEIAQDPAAYTAFDWELHAALARASGNPVYSMILNGFESLYAQMALLYFAFPGSRDSSRRFYRRLARAVRDREPGRAARIVEEVMRESIELWRKSVGRSRPRRR